MIVCAGTESYVFILFYWKKNTLKLSFLKSTSAQIAFKC